MPGGCFAKLLARTLLNLGRRGDRTAQGNDDSRAHMQEIECCIVFHRDAAGKIQCLKRTLSEIDRAQNSIEGSLRAPFGLLLCESFLHGLFQPGEQVTVAFARPLVLRRTAHLPEFFSEAVSFISRHLPCLHSGLRTFSASEPPKAPAHKN